MWKLKSLKKYEDQNYLSRIKGDENYILVKNMLSTQFDSHFLIFIMKSWLWLCCGCFKVSQIILKNMNMGNPNVLLRVLKIYIEDIIDSQKY